MTDYFPITQLPSVILRQLLGYLSIRDRKNLRLTSKLYSQLIMTHDSSFRSWKIRLSMEGYYPDQFEFFISSRVPIELVLPRLIVDWSHQPVAKREQIRRKTSAHYAGHSDDTFFCSRLVKFIEMYRDRIIGIDSTIQMLCVVRSIIPKLENLLEIKVSHENVFHPLVDMRSESYHLLCGCHCVGASSRHLGALLSQSTPTLEQLEVKDNDAFLYFDDLANFTQLKSLKIINASPKKYSENSSNAILNLLNRCRTSVKELILDGVILDPGCHITFNFPVLGRIQIKESGEIESEVLLASPNL